MAKQSGPPYLASKSLAPAFFIPPPASRQRGVTGGRLSNHLKLLSKQRVEDQIKLEVARAGCGIGDLVAVSEHVSVAAPRNSRSSTQNGRRVDGIQPQDSIPAEIGTGCPPRVSEQGGVALSQLLRQPLPRQKAKKTFTVHDSDVPGAEVRALFNTADLAGMPNLSNYLKRQFPDAAIDDRLEGSEHEGKAQLLGNGSSCGGDDAEDRLPEGLEKYLRGKREKISRLHILKAHAVMSRSMQHYLTLRYGDCHAVAFDVQWDGTSTRGQGSSEKAKALNSRGGHRLVENQHLNIASAIATLFPGLPGQKQQEVFETNSHAGKAVQRLLHSTEEDRNRMVKELFWHADNSTVTFPCPVLLCSDVELKKSQNEAFIHGFYGWSCLAPLLPSPRQLLCCPFVRTDGGAANSQFVFFDLLEKALSKHSQLGCDDGAEVDLRGKRRSKIGSAQVPPHKSNATSSSSSKSKSRCPEPSQDNPDTRLATLKNQKHAATIACDGPKRLSNDYDRAATGIATLNASGDGASNGQEDDDGHGGDTSVSGWYPFGGLCWMHSEHTGSKHGSDCALSIMNVGIGLVVSGQRRCASALSRNRSYIGEAVHHATPDFVPGEYYRPALTMVAELVSDSRWHRLHSMLDFFEDKDETSDTGDESGEESVLDGYGGFDWAEENVRKRQRISGSALIDEKANSLQTPLQQKRADEAVVADLVSRCRSANGSDNRNIKSNSPVAESKVLQNASDGEFGATGDEEKNEKPDGEVDLAQKPRVNMGFKRSRRDIVAPESKANPPSKKRKTHDDPVPEVEVQLSQRQLMRLQDQFVGVSKPCTSRFGSICSSSRQLLPALCSNLHRFCNIHCEKNHYLREAHFHEFGPGVQVNVVLSLVGHSSFVVHQVMQAAKSSQCRRIAEIRTDSVGTVLRMIHRLEPLQEPYKRSPNSNSNSSSSISKQSVSAYTQFQLQLAVACGALAHLTAASDLHYNRQTRETQLLDDYEQSADPAQFISEFCRKKPVRDSNMADGLRVWFSQLVKKEPPTRKRIMDALVAIRKSSEEVSSKVVEGYHKTAQLAAARDPSIEVVGCRTARSVLSAWFEAVSRKDNRRAKDAATVGGVDALRKRDFRQEDVFRTAIGTDVDELRTHREKKVEKRYNGSAEAFLDIESRMSAENHGDAARALRKLATQHWMDYEIGQKRIGKTLEERVYNPAAVKFSSEILESLPKTQYAIPKARVKGMMDPVLVKDTHRTISLAAAYKARRAVGLCSKCIDIVPSSSSKAVIPKPNGATAIKSATNIEGKPVQNSAIPKGKAKAKVATPPSGCSPEIGVDVLTAAAKSEQQREAVETEQELAAAVSKRMAVRDAIVEEGRKVLLLEVVHKPSEANLNSVNPMNSDKAVARSELYIVGHIKAQKGSMSLTAVGPLRKAVVGKASDETLKREPTASEFEGDVADGDDDGRDVIRGGCYGNDGLPGKKVDALDTLMGRDPCGTIPTAGGQGDRIASGDDAERAEWALPFAPVFSPTLITIPQRTPNGKYADHQSYSLKTAAIVSISSSEIAISGTLPYMPTAEEVAAGQKLAAKESNNSAENASAERLRKLVKKRKPPKIWKDYSESDVDEVEAPKWVKGKPQASDQNKKKRAKAKGRPKGTKKDYVLSTDLSSISSGDSSEESECDESEKAAKEATPRAAAGVEGFSGRSAYIPSWKRITESEKAAAIQSLRDQRQIKDFGRTVGDPTARSVPLYPKCEERLGFYTAKPLRSHPVYYALLHLPASVSKVQITGNVQRNARVRKGSRSEATVNYLCIRAQHLARHARLVALTEDPPPEEVAIMEKQLEEATEEARAHCSRTGVDFARDIYPVMPEGGWAHIQITETTIGPPKTKSLSGIKRPKGKESASGKKSGNKKVSQKDDPKEGDLANQGTDDLDDQKKDDQDNQKKSELGQQVEENLDNQRKDDERKGEKKDGHKNEKKEENRAEKKVKKKDKRRDEDEIKKKKDKKKKDKKAKQKRKAEREKEKWNVFGPRKRKRRKPQVDMKSHPILLANKGTGAGTSSSDVRNKAVIAKSGSYALLKEGASAKGSDDDEEEEDDPLAHIPLERTGWRNLPLASPKDGGDEGPKSRPLVSVGATSSRSWDRPQAVVSCGAETTKRTPGRDDTESESESKKRRKWHHEL